MIDDKDAGDEHAKPPEQRVSAQGEPLAPAPAPVDESKLIYLSQFRQQKGIPERHQRAAETIRSVGDGMIDTIGAELIKQGRLDLVPRTIAYVMRGLWAHLSDKQYGVRSRLLDRTVDFMVANEVGHRVGQYERLMNSLVRHGFTPLSPFEARLALPHAGLSSEDTIQVAAIANSPRRFKALAISTSVMSFLVCVDRMHGGVCDLHIREMCDQATRVPFNIRSCDSLNTRAKLVKADYLKHMGQDGELSMAPRDLGYVCSVWTDDDVDGGWVTSEAFLHFDSLALVTFVLDKVCEMMDERNQSLLGSQDDGL